MFVFQRRSLGENWKNWEELVMGIWCLLEHIIMEEMKSLLFMTLCLQACMLFCMAKEALTWVIRSRIALGVATGIEYLHSLGPKVTHGNIKSSNILLTHYYDAYVSEFGLTQLISPTSNSKMTGYCTPEVTDIRNVSQKADVYSFGTILLELLTGKNPSSAINEEGIDLPKWVKSIVESQVLDPELIRFQNSGEEQMVSLMHLAISCTSQHPERRPPMADITRRIKQIFR